MTGTQAQITFGLLFQNVLGDWQQVDSCRAAARMKLFWHPPKRDPGRQGRPALRHVYETGLDSP